MSDLESTIERLRMMRNEPRRDIRDIIAGTSSFTITHSADRPSIRVGATQVQETMVASPFSQAQMKPKADAIIAARKSSEIPYYVFAFTPVDQNKDVKVHIEPFDVSTDSPAPSDNIFATDDVAKKAAMDRYLELTKSMAPYCYAAVYAKGVSIIDHFEPPKVQTIDTTTTTTKEKDSFLAWVGGILGVGAFAFLIGRKRKH